MFKCAKNVKDIICYLGSSKHSNKVHPKVYMHNQNMQEINLQLSMTEIEEMSEAKFKNILKKKIKIAALAT